MERQAVHAIPAWIEVDLDAVSQNVEVIRERIGSHSAVLAVVKSDGYGMGCREVADAARGGGAAFFGVANYTEAVRLEEKVDAKWIMLLHPPFDEEIPAIVERGYIQAVDTFRIAEMLSREAVRKGKEVRAHLSVDVGIRRLGFRAAELLERIAEMAKLPRLRFTGIFAHFSSADEEDRQATLEEFGRFEDLLEELENRGVTFQHRHISNSAGILNFPQFSLDLVRPGILLYGVAPSRFTPVPAGMKQTISVKTRVIHVSRIEAGETVSYHRTWKALRSGNLATVPAGYADGIPEELSNAGQVLIRGKRYPVAGLVCMDLTVIDTGGDRIEPEEEVVFLGKQGGEEISVSDWALTLRLDPHGILTGLGKKLPKIYVRAERQTGPVIPGIRET